MFEVKRTQEFDEWLKALPDRDGAARIDARLARLALGSFGDHKPISEGLSELKIDVGPGYRVYYARRGETLYLLLCGGDKSTQKKDITRALGMLGKLKEEASDGKGKSKGKSSKGKSSKGKS
jgi:putative addiction module killer protein